MTSKIVLVTKDLVIKSSLCISFDHFFFQLQRASPTLTGPWTPTPPTTAWWRCDVATTSSCCTPMFTQSVRTQTKALLGTTSSSKRSKTNLFVILKLRKVSTGMWMRFNLRQYQYNVTMRQNEVSNLSSGFWRRFRLQQSVLSLSRLIIGFLGDMLGDMLHSSISPIDFVRILFSSSLFLLSFCMNFVARLSQKRNQ